MITFTQCEKQKVGFSRHTLTNFLLSMCNYHEERVCILWLVVLGLFTDCFRVESVVAFLFRFGRRHLTQSLLGDVPFLRARTKMYERTWERSYDRLVLLTKFQKTQEVVSLNPRYYRPLLSCSVVVPTSRQDRRTGVTLTVHVEVEKADKDIE